MRVFVAIDLPDEIREELEVLQDALPVGRPVPPENLHLTLSFLGEQPEDAIEEAHEALSSIRLPAFDLRLDGVGTFGNPSPKVIFAEMAGNSALDDLERRVTRSLRHAGLDFQKRRFRPHVTLARMPKILSPFDLARVRDFLADHVAFRGASFRVVDFHMYRSVLMPEGAIHDVLASYNLIDR